MVARKKISEIMKMGKDELYQYFRQNDLSLQDTDIIEMKAFDHGLKIFYFHKDSKKPYKTRVYLNSDESEALK